MSRWFIGWRLGAAALLVAIAGATLLGPASSQPLRATAAAPAESDVAAMSRVREHYGRLPLAFEANRGQTDSLVKFLARGSGYTLFLTSDEAVLSLAATRTRTTAAATADSLAEGAVVRLRLVGGSATQFAALEELPGRVNYFVGFDPAGWRTNVPAYAKVVARDVYPGVDLVYYGNQGKLEYDFNIAPGADPSGITLRFEGADEVVLDDEGALIVRVAGRQLRQARPRIYQDIDAKRQEIPGRYVLREQNSVGFELGSYDATRSLVIDPTLIYSTYLGGSGTDAAFGIAVDGAGSAYATGETTSVDFPSNPGSFDTTPNGGYDVFVTKLNATGSAVMYSTYLGGNLDDYGLAIAVGTFGDAYVTGETRSTNFPATPGAADTTFNGSFGDAFVARLDPTGATLVYSTALGGGGQDQGYGIALDSAGSAYVTGRTTSSDFPTTPGSFDTTFNVDDGFVTKVAPTGSLFVYSTYLGGTASDQGSAIAVDGLGSAYVTGTTGSGNFPVTFGALQTAFGGVRDAFVSKLNVVGSGLVYSTYLGGSDIDDGFGIAVDAAGDAFVTGRTLSVNFPTTIGSLDTTLGSVDAFVTKLVPSGSGLAYSTYLGGSVGEEGLGIAIDSLGDAYVTGGTGSVDFPTTAGAFQTSYGGGGDVFVTKLNPAGSATVYSTYLGGSSSDEGFGIAVDSVRNAYVTGLTTSTNFPTTLGAFDTSANGGGFDAFVAKIEDVAPPATLVLTPKTATNPVRSNHTVTATVKNASGNPTPGITVRFSVSGANSASGSGTSPTDANGQATFTYSGTTAGTDTISAFADTNGNGTQDTGEPSDTASKIWIPAILTLSPAAATNPAGTNHTLTATLQLPPSGAGVPGIVIHFTVTGSIFTSGTCTTNAIGQCTFTYAGPPGVGGDSISAFADMNGSGMFDPGEPNAIASKIWIPAGPATLTLAPKTATNPVGTSHTVTATVKDASGNPTPGITVRFSVR